MPGPFLPTTITDETFIRGAARLMWAGTTITFPATIGAIINLSTYDPMTGWNDLGATKTGIQITVNNTEETFDVDQILTDINTLPNAWECSVATQIAEMNLEKLQIIWEGGYVTTATEDGIANVKTMGFGAPTAYTQRRLAVLFQRPTGKIRAFIFRKAQRSPQESTINFAKEGEQQTAAVRFKALPDTSISDIYQRFFLVKDQT